MKPITVFTPTYNRAHTIKHTYDSLCNQTNKNFIWLIIDDGSIDNTKELIDQWRKEELIEIKYFFKENGGLHTAYNEAIRLIKTELCVCIDSDDFMPENGIEMILKTWDEVKSEDIAGIIGLDFNSKTNEPIGGYFSKDKIKMHFLEIENKLRHYGDVKMVTRTELLLPLIPMPSFKGEKNFNPIYLYLLINPRYLYYIINENFCYVDYQEEGMSANIFNQYVNSPRSFATLRILRLKSPYIDIKRKFMDNIHIVAESLLARDIKILKDLPQKRFILLTLPLGILLYFYILFKTKRF